VPNLAFVFAVSLTSPEDKSVSLVELRIWVSSHSYHILHVPFSVDKMMESGISSCQVPDCRHRDCCGRGGYCRPTLLLSMVDFKSS
jgi:hypothetical protein